MVGKYYYDGEGKPSFWLQPIMEDGKIFDIDFFRFTNMLDWNKQGDDEAVLEPLVSLLSQWGDELIFPFHDKMAELL